MTLPTRLDDNFGPDIPLWFNKMLVYNCETIGHKKSRCFQASHGTSPVIKSNWVHIAKIYNGRMKGEQREAVSPNEKMGREQGSGAR